MKCPLCGHEKPHKHGKTSKAQSVISVQSVGKLLLKPSILYITVVKSAKKMCELYCFYLDASGIRAWELQLRGRAELTDYPWTWNDIATYPTLL